jgi:RhtB (resistance to homoserine/threonine) family protein
VHGYWAQFAAVAVAHMLAVAAPGPDFAMVLRQSLVHGRRAAIWTSIGIGTAILLHVTYAVLGIGILLKASHFWFSVAKFLGAGYLAWIGLKALRSRPSGESQGAQGGEAPQGPAEPTPRSAWTTGFITNAFNPKVTLFFVAIFATIIDPATPRWIQAAYGVWMSLATMAWFTMVSLFFTRESVRRAFLRKRHWIDRAMGVVLIGLAVVLALATAR